MTTGGCSGAENRRFYDERAEARERECRRHYHTLLKRYFRFYVPPNRRVLELGCGLGDLLDAVRPRAGVGVDFSPRVIEIARRRHPQLEFHVAEATEYCHIGEPADYLLLSDLTNDLGDVQGLLESLHRLAHDRTRLVINFFNALWYPVLSAAERLGLKSPTPPQNWLSRSDMINLLELADWEVVRSETRILWPVRTPGIAAALNRWVAPFLSHFCLTIFLIARPRPALDRKRRDYRSSVVIPARNEAGNIEEAVRRVPELGSGTEIIFVEGESEDRTWETIGEVAQRFPHRNIQTIKQQSRGKGGAVREGFAAATGDIFMILDADLTVPPEELTKFYELLRSGKAELGNGVRFVYPMEKEAMRFLNMLGNKFFSTAFSWLLGQRIKDTLCGTKVLFREDYEAIVENRDYFGEFDPFGDFDLLFGAARLNLKIVDLPIRYHARVYGETNIRRWRHAWLLFRMVAVGARRLKFI